MRRRTRTALLLLVGLPLAAPAAPAQKGPVRVFLALGPVQQLGPAYSGEPVGLVVEVRNVGQNDCEACQMRVLGGGVVATQALPRIPPGVSAKVTMGGLVFLKAGRYALSIVLDGPKDVIEFGGTRPHATFEMVVLEGPPARRAAPR